MSRLIALLAAMLVAAAPLGARRWCSRDDGTLTADTAFLAVDVCPSLSERDELKLFRFSELQTFTLTTPVQLAPGDTVEIRGYAGGGLPIFSIEEHVGPADGMLLTIADDALRLRSADGKTSKIYGHVDTLPASCSVGDMATRNKPLTFPDTAQLCVCKFLDIWGCLDLP